MVVYINRLMPGCRVVEIFSTIIGYQEDMRIVSQIDKAWLKSRNVTKLNPLGKLPFLTSDSVGFNNSFAIIQYMCEKSNKGAELFLGTTAASSVTEFLGFCTQDLNVAALRLMNCVLKKLKGVDPKDQEYVNATEQLYTVLDYLLERFLAGYSFILGSKLTVCDLYGSCYVTQALGAGVKLPAKYREIESWLERVETSVGEVFTKTHQGIRMISSYVKTALWYQQLKQTQMEQEMLQLQVKLDNYYEQFAKIDDTKMKDAMDVVETVRKNIQEFFETRLPNYPVGRIVLSGSTADHTKVITPEEFDYMIPLKIPKGIFQIDNPSRPLYNQIVLVQQKEKAANWNGWCDLIVHYTKTYDDEMIEDKYYLSPKKVAVKIQDLLERILNSWIKEFKLPDRVIEIRQVKPVDLTYGPNTTLQVTYDLRPQKRFDVDFTGYIQTDDNCLPHVVNKSYDKQSMPVFIKNSCGPGYEPETLLEFLDPVIYWRKSFSFAESQLVGDPKLEENMRKCLMIYKAIFHNNSNFHDDVLTSYHLKNIVLNLAYERDTLKQDTEIDTPDSIETVPTPAFTRMPEVNAIKPYTSTPNKWLEKSLPEQFISVLNSLLMFVRYGRMPWHFDSNVTLVFDIGNPKKTRQSRCCETKEKTSQIFDRCNKQKRL
ncbi:unnamed protein product [Owenia fusiformis]|uniref:Uncharacterized protein n=1 Tax=Owenia fusiformis TaxID=6347 RepID=A0A8J1U0J2_OWEFU|nr:unnamed protein product [Owenia fusiformis]